MDKKMNRTGKQITKVEVLDLDDRKKDIQSTVNHPDYDLYIDEGSSLNEYISVIKRRKKVVLACLFISILIVGVASITMQKIYKATTTIEIAPDDPKVTGFQEVMEVKIQEQDEFYETQYKLLKSRSLARDVTNKLNLKAHPEFDPNKKPGVLTIIKDAIAGLIMKITASGKDEYPIQGLKELSEEERLTDAFLRRVSVAPDRDSRLVEVSFESIDPKLSAKAVNTLANQYIEWVLEKKHGVTKAAVQSLNTQLKRLKEKLKETQDELSEFAKKWDIVSLDKDLNLTYKQLADLNEALAKAETERLSQEAIFEETKAGNYELLPQVMSDPSIRQLKTEYVKLQSQYDNLDARYGVNYPDMKEISAQVTRVRYELESQLNEISRSIKKGYEAAKKKEDILRQRTDVQKTRAMELNEVAVQYQILQREVDTNKTIYQDLLQRLKETEVTSGIRATNVQVIDYASPPLKPYKPNILFNVLIAGIMGLMTGVMLAFGFEHFDRTIRDEEDIKRRFPIPFMGKIPAASRSEVGILSKIVYTNPLSNISEAFRVLKTSVLYTTRNDSAPKALLVTSTQPLEGKTTVSCNLALTMVQSGLKVILVDADLRRPSLHKIFMANVKNGSGMSTYLSGKTNIESIIYHTEIDGLDVIPVGPIMQNPADLIDSKPMKQLIERLVKDYDNVILDGIPVMELADTRLLSRQVDGVLLVASMGIAHRDAFKNSIEELMKVGARIIGVVINRVDIGSMFGGSYNYNYRPEDKEKKKTTVQV